LLDVLTNIVFVMCDILPEIQLKTVNSTSVFLLKCRRITSYANTWTVFGSSDEYALL